MRDREQPECAERRCDAPTRPDRAARRRRVAARHLQRLAACGLLAATLALFADAAQAAKRAISDTTTVVAVEIPVQVTVDGKPVRGLTRDDFALFEGRRERTLVGFDVLDLTAPTVSQPTAAPVAADAPARAGRRYFLLLFDLANSEPSAMLRAREAARRLVAESLHPTDLVGVATYSAIRGPRVLLAFTSDREQVALAIDTLGLVELRDRTPDPLALQLDATGDGFTRPGGNDRSDRGDRTAEALKRLEQAAQQQEIAYRQNRAALIDAFTQGMADLGRLLAAVDGRKYVVLLSQGFDSSVVTGSGAGAQAEDARAVESGQIWEVDSDQRFGDTGVANDLERMLEEMRRADCVLQTVDIGGLVADGDQQGRPSGRDTLLTMARDTGGQLYENFNDLGAAMGQMLESTSVTYVLTFQPEALAADGRFRPVKVKLARDIPGARLSHRPGYYAPRPAAETPALERQLDTAQLLLAGIPGGSLRAHTVLAAFPGAEREHVPVVVAVAGEDLARTASDGKIDLAAYVYALDENGLVRDFVSQTANLDLAQVGDRLRTGGFRLAGDLLLAPGTYRVRSLVRAGTAGDYALEEIAFEVPTFGSETAASTPVSVEAMTSGIVVRAGSSAAKTANLPFRFAIGDQFYLPDGLPTRRAGDTLDVLWPIHGFGPGDLALRAELAGPTGPVAAVPTIRRIKRLPAEAGGLERLWFGLALGDAPAGDLRLELVVEQDGRRVSGTIPLRVTE